MKQYTNKESLSSSGVGRNENRRGQKRRGKIAVLILEKPLKISKRKRE
jgi:hypothetical protein